MLLMESISKVRCLGRSGVGVREIARRTGFSRVTVRKYLRGDGERCYRRTKEPERRVLDQGHRAQLSLWFESDLKRPVRERRSAHGLYEQLVLEGYEGSYTTVQRYVRGLRRSVEGTSSSKAFVPLEFTPGDAMQFDWSQETVVLGGIETRVKVAHFRLCHSRKMFVRAYYRESQEMVLDAFNQAVSFYEGVPRRVIIDNPKTMVLFVGKSKDRDLHPRFKALLNHYVLEATACTPASGWEKGQVENQVGHARGKLFTPMARFDSLEALNDWLALRCRELDDRAHPGDKTRQVAQVLEEEAKLLHPVGRPFDGYLARQARVLSTCLIQYDSNRYSVPAMYAGQKVGLRVYADTIKVASDHKIIAEHKREFGRHVSVFEPWHYVPILKRKPGALRDGAPFVNWQLPGAMVQIRDLYLKQPGGDREFVELLLKAQDHGMDVVQMACELAVEAKTLRLPAITNLINQLVEPVVPARIEVHPYPELSVRPEANCHRYEALIGTGSKVRSKVHSKAHGGIKGIDQGIGQGAMGQEAGL